MNIAGFVLTGGRSVRMGRDKATLSLHGRNLAEHVADVVASVAETVFLVGHPERYAHLRYKCIPDLHPDLGPLSGLEAALSLNFAEFNIVTGCDMANLQASWLHLLVAEAAKGRRCVVAESPGGALQPLCAVYRNDCLPAVSHALSRKNLRMMDLLLQLSASSVKIGDSILNVNTPEEYSKVADGDGTEPPLH